MDDFDKLVADIQAEVDKQDKEDFSEYALDLMRNPYNHGKLEPSNTVITQSYTGSCGDTIIFHFDIQQSTIKKATFEVVGCSISSLAGSQTVKMVEHKTIEEARKLKNTDLLKAFGRFPEDSVHCAKLAVDTLNLALDKYENN